MKANEINFKELNGFTIYPAGSHCRIAMWNTFFMPTTKAQAKTWIGYVGKNITSQVIYSQTQINHIDSFMNEYGKEADFMFTKSKSMVRLKNFQDFIFCIKKKFDIK